MSACSERLTELDYTPIQQNDEPRLIVSVALTSLSWHVCMSGDLFHLYCMISVDVVQRTVDVVDRLAEGDGAAAISPQHGTRLCDHAAGGGQWSKNVVQSLIFVVSVFFGVAAADDVQAPSTNEQAKFILLQPLADCSVSAVSSLCMESYRTVASI